MKHAIVIAPDNPRELYDYAITKSYSMYIDEKDTEAHPGFARKTSKLTYEEAYELIQNNVPHWTISFRNNTYFNIGEKDHWEFGGCNIGNNSYGSVFIWILVDVDEAESIFEKFNLTIDTE